MAAARHGPCTALAKTASTIQATVSGRLPASPSPLPLIFPAERVPGVPPEPMPGTASDTMSEPFVKTLNARNRAGPTWLLDRLNPPAADLRRRPLACTPLGHDGRLDK